MFDVEQHSGRWMDVMSLEMGPAHTRNTVKTKVLHEARLRLLYDALRELRSGNKQTNRKNGSRPRLDK